MHIRSTVGVAVSAVGVLTAALILPACGDSTPAPVITVAPPPVATPSPSPTPSPENSLSAYLDCLKTKTVEECAPLDPYPETPTPTPAATTPSAGPAQHFTARVQLFKGPFALSVGDSQVTGCTGDTGPYSDIGDSTAFVVKTGNVTLASTSLGKGSMTNGECDFNLDLGTFPQQNQYVTSFSSGKHGTLTWTLTEMQGKNFFFVITLGK